ncbi:hypothetical protein [Pyrobaculum neutrophilum]|uniref:Uncharacterized protein n=1 Tax=Pyrobaculum neutrophilum (strain DSM 2338 / JCM 9278 / NBRC 100436 / V24Sta) TaxID=444157 RepID=B1YA47_PYRNV|nr:hypothetical protein [Pyrobaculum neutrophilum]ACB39021.1 conserved hypothetical protein [Pyrobaculum neutrophilum V24Sta]
MRWLIPLAVAAALIAVYLMLQPPPPPQAGITTTATPQQPTTAPTQTTATAQTPTATAQPTATTTTAPRPPAPQPVYLPKITWRLSAPPVVNTTKLPLAVNYTITLANEGNGTGAVEVDGVVYTLKPGERINVTKSVVAKTAGRQKIAVVINGTEYAYATAVYYYAPKLVAEPIAVNVTKMPANATVEIVIKNVGNYSAVVDGVVIQPGQTARIKTTLNITAAGTYYVNYSGVPIAVTVNYLTPNVEYKLGGPTYLEVLPGENATAWLWLYNRGNATAEVKIDGRAYAIAPRSYINITKSVRINSGGLYAVVFHAEGALNGTLEWRVKAALVAVRVEIVVWKPDLMRSWPAPTDTLALSVTSKSVDIAWGYIISTNATYRPITLNIQGPGGGTYVLKPGAYISANSTATLQAPGTGELAVYINGTKYATTIRLDLKPPTVSVSDVSQIWFEDARPIYSVQINCRVATIQFDLMRVSGTVTYSPTATNLQGTITVKTASGVYTGDYSGYVSGNSGHVSISIAGRRVDIDFTVSPLAPTRILVDGSQVTCTAPTYLIPPVLYRQKPTTPPTSATAYASALVSLFAKQDGDRAQSAVWNGDYVEVTDGWGNKMAVYIRQGQIEISGALSARITAVIS